MAPSPILEGGILQEKLAFGSRVTVKRIRMMLDENKYYNADAAPLFACEIETPLGRMIAEANHKGLSRLQFMSSQEVAPFDSHDESHPRSDAALFSSHPLFEKLNYELAAYFARKSTSFSVPLSPQGTPFQQKVWQALGKIPFGKTRNYQEIAHHINCPKAFRAVGNANGKNPIALLVPCHRVVTKNANIGGYSAGIWRKEALLKLEKAQYKSLSMR